MQEITYHNFRQQIIEEIFPQVAVKMDFCTCERCKADAIAIALNNSSPKYVVSLKGEVLSRYTEFFIQQKTDVIIQIIKAITIVKNNPHH